MQWSRIRLLVQETRESQPQSLVWEHALEQEMATCSSSLAWRTPWTAMPDGLQSMGSQKVGQNWAHTQTAIVNLQCCVSFRCVAKRFSYSHIYICIYMSVSDSFLSYYKIEYSSLCIWFFFKSAYSSVSFGASYTYRFYMFFHLFQSLTSFLSPSLFFPPCGFSLRESFLVC